MKAFLHSEKVLLREWAALYQLFLKLPRFLLQYDGLGYISIIYANWNVHQSNQQARLPVNIQSKLFSSQQTMQSIQLQSSMKK